MAIKVECSSHLSQKKGNTVFLFNNEMPRKKNFLLQLIDNLLSRGQQTRELFKLTQTNPIFTFVSKALNLKFNTSDCHICSSDLAKLT